jgi:hypothetical protein
VKALNSNPSTKKKKKDRKEEEEEGEEEEVVLPSGFLIKGNREAEEVRNSPAPMETELGWSDECVFRLEVSICLCVMESGSQFSPSMKGEW